MSDAPLSTDVSAEDSRHYSQTRRRLMLLDMALSLLWLAVIQWSGFSQKIAGYVKTTTSQEWIIITEYLALFGLLTYCVMLPLHFYSGFTVEHRFHLSRMSLKSWCVRELKQLAVSAVLGLGLVQGLYTLLRAEPATWPLWATVGWVGFSVVLAKIFPTVLLPIFYKTEPVKDKGLVDRLLGLCGKVKLPALGVFRFNMGAETRKANAALAGLGGTRRVLLSDTLINEFTVDEIEGVLAHELAHHHYRHIPKQLIISAAGSWIAFSLTRLAADRWIAALRLNGLSDIAGFPMIMLWLSLLGLIGLPLQNSLSRYFEWQSDHFAVAATKQPKAFADALRRLAKLNLADLDPPQWMVWLFYDHPPIAERIAAAEVKSLEP